MRAITARERRITALMCTLLALTCVIDVGQELYKHQPVDYWKVFAGASLLALAGFSLHRARAGT